VTAGLARNKNSYQFDGRDSVTQARSISSVSGDSYEDGHKRHYTGSSCDKSDHDKVHAFRNCSSCHFRHTGCVFILVCLLNNLWMKFHEIFGPVAPRRRNSWVGLGWSGFTSFFILWLFIMWNRVNLLMLFHQLYIVVVRFRIIAKSDAQNSYINFGLL